MTNSSFAPLESPTAAPAPTPTTPTSPSVLPPTPTQGNAVNTGASYEELAKLWLEARNHWSTGQMVESGPPDNSKLSFVPRDTELRKALGVLTQYVDSSSPQRAAESIRQLLQGKTDISRVRWKEDFENIRPGSTTPPSADQLRRAISLLADPSTRTSGGMVAFSNISREEWLASAAFGIGSDSQVDKWLDDAFRGNGFRKRLKDQQKDQQQEDPQKLKEHQTPAIDSSTLPQKPDVGRVQETIKTKDGKEISLGTLAKAKFSQLDESLLHDKVIKKHLEPVGGGGNKIQIRDKDGDTDLNPILTEARLKQFGFKKVSHADGVITLEFVPSEDAKRRSPKDAQGSALWNQGESYKLSEGASQAYDALLNSFPKYLLPMRPKIINTNGHNQITFEDKGGGYYQYLSAAGNEAANKFGFDVKTWKNGDKVSMVTLTYDPALIEKGKSTPDEQKAEERAKQATTKKIVARGNAAEMNAVAASEYQQLMRDRGFPFLQQVFGPHVVSSTGNTITLKDDDGKLYAKLTEQRKGRTQGESQQNLQDYGYSISRNETQRTITLTFDAEKFANSTSRALNFVNLPFIPTVEAPRTLGKLNHNAYEYYNKMMADTPLWAQALSIASLGTPKVLSAGGKEVIIEDKNGGWYYAFTENEKKLLRDYGFEARRTEVNGTNAVILTFAPEKLKSKS